MFHFVYLQNKSQCYVNTQINCSHVTVINRVTESDEIHMRYRLQVIISERKPHCIKRTPNTKVERPTIAKSLKNYPFTFFILQCLFSQAACYFFTWKVNWMLERHLVLKHCTLVPSNSPFKRKGNEIKLWPPWWKAICTHFYTKYWCVFD